MTPDDSYHMTADEFRRHGKAMVDWIADYLERVEELPVLSQVAPGAIRAALPSSPPMDPEPFDAVLADLDRVVVPGLTHWQSPNFFAYFPANSSGPSILGELLGAGLGVQGMLWATSPACTEVETHVLDWLVDLMGLPPKFKSTGPGGGVIQDTASSAVLCALLAARDRLTQGQANQQGTDGKLVAYASVQAHSSVEKAMGVAGLGRSQLRLIPVDERFALRSDALRDALAQDRAAGFRPCFVCATLGTTSANGFDPVEELGPMCREAGLWLHVDAAMAGAAALCPEFRWIHRGMEWADSYAFNPHKWLFTNFDCDCFFVADRGPLIRSLSILPEYLKNQATQSGAVIDYRDWHVPLGRRFRSLKLWFVLRHYGVRGLQHHLRQHVQWAQELAGWIRADARFELVLPPPLNLVCFRHRGGENVNQELMDRLNRGGRLYLTHTRLDGKLTLRLCVAQTHTQRHHVEAAWDLICTTAAQMEAEAEAGKGSASP